MRIISQRKHIESISYLYHFTWKNNPGTGFSFECDKNGNIDESKMNPIGLNNLYKCYDGTYNIVDHGVQEVRNSYIEPAIGECDQCVENVELYGFTNTCDNCGTDYNMSGQQLACRSQWGEETGECLSDILSIV